MTETSPFLWIETGFPLNGLIYINGVVAGYNGSVIYASRDGINWDAYDTGVALQYVFPHGGKLYFSFSFRRPYAIPHIWDPSSIIQVASLVDYGCYDPETDLITTCSGQVRQDMTTGNILSNMPAFIVTDDNFLLSVPNIVSATNYWYTGGACYLAWNLITNEVIMRGLGDLPVPNHGTYHSAYWYSYRPIRIGDDIYVFGYDTDSRYNGSIIFKHSSQDGGDWIAIDHGMENLRNSNGFILPPRPAAYFTDMWLSNSDKLMFLHRENTVYETATRDNSENYDIYSLGYSCKSLSFGSNYFVAVDGLKYNYAKMSHLGHLNENTLWNEGTLPVFSTKIIALRNGIFIVNGGAIGIFTTDIQESHLNDYKGIFPFNRSKLFTGYYGIRFTMKPEENSSQKDIKPVIIDSLILPVVSAVTSASSLIAPDSATFTAAA
ncbi:MAG: hypothetical protein O0X96_07895, partial [Methanocorpusculum sp.]|nr:hypothetical protein [Methanocorpusculum sp.]